LKKFSIIITTKNRRDDLAFTLAKIAGLLDRDDVECLICDDGSTDDTFSFLTAHPLRNIQFFKNETSKGLIYNRNLLLQKATGEFAISIDDDLHFITENPLEIIESYFREHTACAIVSFRIFWGLSEPSSTETTDLPKRVKSFAGGAHAMRLASWRKIPDYPEWFVFHGEENYVAFEMFRAGMEIHYLPAVLTHHRVDNRSKREDYLLRQRYSLRSGWYLYFLFKPWRVIPKNLAASVWNQMTSRVFKGKLNILGIMTLAMFDLVGEMPNILKHRNKLSYSQYKTFSELAETKIYWIPESKGQS